jgi:predicted transposase YdaD
MQRQVDSLAKSFHKRGEMMEESVVYQDILQKGEQRGEKKLAMRLLERRCGKLGPKIRRQAEQLSVERMEELCEALLDFKAPDDLIAWLKQHNA